jgi:hypothetical protein
MKAHATAFVLGLAAMIGGAPVLAAEPAGKVVLATGQASASAVDSLEMRLLTRDDPVYSGEVVSSGPNSYVNLKFNDGGLTLLRPNSRFLIESYADPGAPPAPEPARQPVPASPTQQTLPTTVTTTEPDANVGGRAFFRLLKGGFRAVSGLIGKADPGEYRISTPVATIGIRGTDYYVVLCDPVCAADPGFDTMLPPGTSPIGGVIVGVIRGNVFVRTKPGQQTELQADQYLLTLPDGTQILLPFEPRFLRIDPIPSPETICES